MKKFRLLTFTFATLNLIFGSLLFSQSSENLSNPINDSILNDSNYCEYTLENSMQVFAFEDFSSATVRLEFLVRAGISAQNQTNTGFFTLYSRLVKKNAENFPELKKISAECNADSSRFVIITTPSEIPAVMDSLSHILFAPTFTDQLIKDELSVLKTEVMQYAFSPAAFINSSIDSRVFSKAPWKHDSGIYPAIFTKTTPSQARTILSDISRAWYIPQNSAIFINGCIKKEAALSIAEKTFGSFPAALKPAKLEAVSPGGTHRKFVIHDPQLSEDLTQIIVQYTSLSMIQSDIAASTLNNSNSFYKTNLIARKNLNIREAEYANVSAAHKNGTSRLIFQALLERNKNSPANQSEEFLEYTANLPQETQIEEFNHAKKFLEASFCSITENSTAFMERLSQFWAIESIYDGKKTESLASTVLQKPAEVENENPLQIQSALKTENPFVFVLVNSKTYEKFKNEFKKAGYEPVTQKNSSWYMQKLQHNASKNLSEENQIEQFSDFDFRKAQESFILQNKEKIKIEKLKNGIPVCIKSNKTTSKAAIVLSIKGGKFADNGNPGFETVLTNSLAANIQNELNIYTQEQILEGFPDVSAETLLTKSLITIECHKDDVSTCIRAIGDALIFGEILPASADIHVYQVQTQKRLSDASPVNQMYFRGIKYLYDDITFRDIFDSEKDILQRTTYTEILAAYPRLLDADIHSLFIAGNFNEESAIRTLNETLGLLSSQKKSNSKKELPKPDFPAKSKRINLKLRHLFYTDVKAEDAGPMPAILVPTKDFLDPVQYWIPAPPQDSQEAVLFNALLFRLQEIFSDSIETKLLLPTKEIPAAAITFLKVKRTNLADILYASKLLEFQKKLQNEKATENEPTDNAAECNAIKNVWILNALSEWGTNKGCAKLMAESDSSPTAVLDAYQLVTDATQKDFSDVAEKWLKGEALLRIYSSEAKR